MGGEGTMDVTQLGGGGVKAHGRDSVGGEGTMDVTHSGR